MNLESDKAKVEEVESLIMKMHSKMKSLESRYLDLANFYKKELLAGNSG